MIVDTVDLIIEDNSNAIGDQTAEVQKSQHEVNEDQEN